MPASEDRADQPLSARRDGYPPRQERRSCNLYAEIRTSYGETHGRIVNLSHGGIGLFLDPVMRLDPGEKFSVHHSAIGHASCVVRWSAHPRYGAEFDATAKKSRDIHAFYDSLSPE